MTLKTTHSARGSIVQGLVIAGVLIATSLAIKTLSPAYLSPGLGQRLFGLVMGAMVVFYANAVPKALSPMLEMRCNPVTEQAIRRFTGWSLALGGTAYAVASLFAPLESATTIAAACLGFSVLLVLGRIAWSLGKGSRA